MLRAIVGTAIWLAIYLVLGTIALYDLMRRRTRREIEQREISIWQIASVVAIFFGSMSTATWGTAEILKACGWA